MNISIVGYPTEKLSRESLPAIDVRETQQILQVWGLEAEDVSNVNIVVVFNHDRDFGGGRYFPNNGSHRIVIGYPETAATTQEEELVRKTVIHELRHLWWSVMRKNKKWGSFNGRHGYASHFTREEEEEDCRGTENIDYFGCARLVVFSRREPAPSFLYK